MQCRCLRRLPFRSKQFTFTDFTAMPSFSLVENVFSTLFASEISLAAAKASLIALLPLFAMNCAKLTPFSPTFSAVLQDKPTGLSSWIHFPQLFEKYRKKLVLVLFVSFFSPFSQPNSAADLRFRALMTFSVLGLRTSRRSWRDSKCLGASSCLLTYLYALYNKYRDSRWN